MSSTFRRPALVVYGATCVVASSAFLLAVAATSCSSEGDTAGTSQFEGGTSPDAGGSSSSGTGSSGFDPSEAQAPEAAPPPPCVASEVEGVVEKGPVDIIFEIDNSISMSEEIAEVENQINTNFANIIEASKSDYRIIMLSEHGNHDGVSAEQKICVKAPLSGTTCNPIPAQPVETARFFHHNVIINSQDTFCQLLNTFGAPDRDGHHPQGWGGLLRPLAFKVFAIITDDRVNTSCNGFTFDDKFDDPISATNTANTFDSALLALSPKHFGSTSHRNYIWHSIVGIAPFDTNDLQKPHPPTSPLVTNTCGSTAVASGLGYQALSKLTGGLRYPTCGLNYTTIFQTMAKDVVDRTVLACDFAMPANPDGGTIDPATAVVRYVTGNGSFVDFEQVKDASTCGPNKFYIDGDRIRLCPDTCLMIQADQTAKVRIRFGCLPKDQNPKLPK